MKTLMKFGVAAAAFASMSLAAGASQAAVYISLQQAGVNGGNITQVATGPMAALFASNYGTFELELITGTQGVDPTILGSTSSDHNFATTTGGVLDIYVTRDDVGGTGPWHLLSSFTTNLLPAGWSILQQTYYNTTNAAPVGASLTPDFQLLASKNFTATGIGSSDVFVGALGAPYSVTTRYTVSAPTSGSAFSTISIESAVPEAGTWALMIMGFGGAGAMLRSRRRASATLA